MVLSLYETCDYVLPGLVVKLHVFCCFHFSFDSCSKVCLLPAAWFRIFGKFIPFMYERVLRKSVTEGLSVGSNMLCKYISIMSLPKTIWHDHWKITFCGAVHRLQIPPCIVFFILILFHFHVLDHTRPLCIVMY